MSGRRGAVGAVGRASVVPATPGPIAAAPPVSCATLGPKLHRWRASSEADPGPCRCGRGPPPRCTGGGRSSRTPGGRPWRIIPSDGLRLDQRMVTRFARRTSGPPEPAPGASRADPAVPRCVTRPGRPSGVSVQPVADRPGGSTVRHTARSTVGRQVQPRGRPPRRFHGASRGPTGRPDAAGGTVAPIPTWPRRPRATRWHPGTDLRAHPRVWWRRGNGLRAAGRADATSVPERHRAPAPPQAAALPWTCTTAAGLRPPPSMWLEPVRRAPRRRTRISTGTAARGTWASATGRPRRASRARPRPRAARSAPG